MAELPQNEKNLVVSFIRFLRQKISASEVNEDQTESLEVAIQCMEAAFNFGEDDLSFHPSRPLLDLFTDADPTAAAPPHTQNASVTDSEKAEAEKLKNEGNDLMKEQNYDGAIQKYTAAIDIFKKAVFYCNRAAAYSKQEKYAEAIQDCRTALSIDPSYSKAYGRMGYREAVDAYKKALELEPDNQSFRNNLEIAEQKSRESGGPQQQQAPNLGANPFGAGGLGGFDIGAMLNNPAMMNMASQMLQDPGVQNMMAGLLGNAAQGGGPGGPTGPGGMADILRAGQQLASQFQNSNPDLVEQLRRNMQDQGPGGSGSGSGQGGNNQNGNPPDGSGSGSGNQ